MMQTQRYLRPLRPTSPRFLPTTGPTSRLRRVDRGGKIERRTVTGSSSSVQTLQTIIKYITVSWSLCLSVLSPLSFSHLALEVEVLRAVDLSFSTDQISRVGMHERIHLFRRSIPTSQGSCLDKVVVVQL